MKTKQWYVRVKVEWSNFGIEGATKEEAIANLKATFDAQYGIELYDSEILEITEEQ
jgi:hypothetical protein